MIKHSSGWKGPVHFKPPKVDLFPNSRLLFFFSFSWCLLCRALLERWLHLCGQIENSLNPITAGHPFYYFFSLHFVREKNLERFNIYLETLCPGQVFHIAVSTIFKSHKTKSPGLRRNHYEVHFEDLCTCFSLDQRIKQLWNIKINQPYMEGHTRTHTRAHTHTGSTAATQGQ